MSIEWATKWADAIEGDGYLRNLRDAIIAGDDAAVKHNLTEIRSITEAIAHEYGLDEQTLERVGAAPDDDGERMFARAEEKKKIAPPLAEPALDPPALSPLLATEPKA